MQPEGLVKLLTGWEDKSAEALCIFAYCDGQGAPHTFIGTCEGNIVDPRGDRGFGWCPIFQPVGFDRTFAELSMEEKNQISHRGKAMKLLVSFLNTL